MSNLTDLNEQLFATLGALNDDKLDPEQLDRAIKKSKAVCSVSTQILHVAQVQISALNTAEKCGLLEKDLPPLLQAKTVTEKINNTENSRRLLGVSH